MKKVKKTKEAKKTNKTSKAVFHRNTCRLCNGKKLELMMKLAPTPIGDDYIPKELLGKKQEPYPVELFLCRSCGHAQLLDVVDPEAVYGNYLYTTSISLGLVEHFHRYADSVLQQISPAKNSLVIDIGSNDGSLLRFYKNQGMRVLGVDPAREIARQATKAGIETLPEFFNLKLAKAIKKKYSSATIVTSNNTFANIDDLDTMTEGIKELLTPDGVFVFETGYVLDLLQKVIIDNIYHEHISYFAVKPLETFFNRHGMEIINVERVPTKGGSLRCTVQLKGGARKASPSVKRIMRLETDLGLQQPEIFKAFETNFNNVKHQLMSLLKSLKAKGRTIIGYGASVGVTTELYNLGIDNNMIDFLVDDNITKHNLYSPGMHIPVLPSQKIYEKKPDYVIIFPWQYIEPIIKKHKEYLEQGGCFINILPQVVVMDKSVLGFYKNT